MNKKILLIIASFIAFSVLFGIFLILSALKPTSPVQNLIPTPTPVSQSSTFEKTVVRGINVNVFLSPTPSLDPAGLPLVVETDTYRIIYHPEDESFAITILASPFVTIQKQAEQQLLSLLGVSQQQACLLQVTISSPSKINPDYTGKIVGLSFCGQ